MRLPEKKQKELEKKGKRKTPPMPGGGAAGRLHQYELERGLDQSDHDKQSPDESNKKGDEKGESSDARH